MRITADAVEGAQSRAGGTARWAKAITDAGAPWVLNAVVPVAVGAALGAPWWGAFVSLVAGVLPIAMIVAMMVRRRVGDVHVTDRSERTGVIAGIVFFVMAGLVVELAASAPAWVVAVTAAGLVTILVVGAVTVLGRWKVSVHTAVAGGWVVLAAGLVSPWVLAAAPLVAVIGWSRVVLRDHTAAQVLVGAALGAALSAAAVAWV